MSKTDTMSEELEKAIERCNELIKVEHANWIGISNQLAIDTVLQELDNSIPKQVIEETIEDNAFEVHTKEWGNVYVLSIEVLQELLEGE